MKSYLHFAVLVTPSYYHVAVRAHVTLTGGVLISIRLRFATLRVSFICHDKQCICPRFLIPVLYRLTLCVTFPHVILRLTLNSLSVTYRCCFGQLCDLGWLLCNRLLCLIFEIRLARKGRRVGHASYIVIMVITGELQNAPLLKFGLAANRGQQT